MKKVWILERFITREEMEKSYEDILSLKNDSDDEKTIETCEKIAASYKENMDENPNGYWSGHVGKSSYKAFCSEAYESLRYWKGKNKKFRVVEGKIEDTDKSWVRYKYYTKKVNDGVLRYLFATM